MQASHSSPRIPFPHISTFNNILLGFFDDGGGAGDIGILVMAMVMDMNMLFLVG